jgi:hypothetical protein
MVMVTENLLLLNPEDEIYVLFKKYGNSSVSKKYILKKYWSIEYALQHVKQLLINDFDLNQHNQNLTIEFREILQNNQLNPEFNLDMDKKIYQRYHIINYDISFSFKVINN